MKQRIALAELTQAVQNLIDRFYDASAAYGHEGKEVERIDALLQTLERDKSLEDLITDLHHLAKFGAK